MTTILVRAVDVQLNMKLPCANLEYIYFDIYRDFDTVEHGLERNVQNAANYGSVPSVSQEDCRKWRVNITSDQDARVQAR